MVAAEDFRRAARRRLPRIFFDYIDGGASAEATLAANVADFGRYRLRPQVLRDVAVRRLDADFLGGRHALPLMLCPVGSLGLFRAGAEAVSFRAACAAGILASMGSEQEEFEIVRGLCQPKTATVDLMMMPPSGLLRIWAQ